MASLEDQIRTELDAARGLSDAAMKVHLGSPEEITTAEMLGALFTLSKALMDCTVDLAKAIDQLAEHVDYPTG